MPPTTIESMAVARLRPSACNARTHSKKQIRQIANSIARFGFTNPILIDSDNHVIAGHGRLEAAKLLGLQHVPAIRLSGLDATQRRAYALADNKLALHSGWDRGALAVELQALVDVTFDVEVTGFSCAEIELVLDSALPGSPPHAESPSSVAGPAAVTRRDDVWRIERHRLLCTGPGDLSTVERLLDGERLVLVALEPALCDRIVAHFRQLTGRDATLAETGQSFAAVAAQRRKEPQR